MKKFKQTRQRTSKRRDFHVTVIVDGTQEEFDTISDSIRKVARKNNHFSDRKMSFDVIRSTFSIDGVSKLE